MFYMVNRREIIPRLIGEGGQGKVFGIPSGAVKRVELQQHREHLPGRKLLSINYQDEVVQVGQYVLQDEGKIIALQNALWEALILEELRGEPRAVQ